MINIRNYESAKYDNSYLAHQDGIFSKDGTYFTSLSFQQEPLLDEGRNPQEISQYPLEDLLDHYGVWVSDFYQKLNLRSSKECYLEFASHKLQSIISLREVIGKHVYNKTVIYNGNAAQILVIE